MKVYEGIRDSDNATGDVLVFVNGQMLPLEPSLKICNHSPTGFSWGYHGSGPSQLALAIMLDYFNGDVEKAKQFYMYFKWDIVAVWPMDKGWKITAAQIEEYINSKQNE